MASNNNSSNSSSSNSDTVRVAIVSGASAGIGAGCVKVFVQNGVKVVFFSNNGEEGRQLEQRLNADWPGQATFVEADCRDESAVKSVVSRCLELHGRIDWLINNVGYHPDHAPPDAFSVSDLRNLMELNVFSAFGLTVQCLPSLRQSRGAIVNIGSMVAKLGQRHAVTYVTTKAAIVGLTRALAIDEAENGVRVNCISPGSVLTPLLLNNSATRGSDLTAELSVFAGYAAMGRLGTVEEVGTACLFLCRDATFTTGVDLPVSGGAELDYGKKCSGQPIVTL